MFIVGDIVIKTLRNEWLVLELGSTWLLVIFQSILEMNWDSTESKSNQNGSKSNQTVFYFTQRLTGIHLLNWLNWCQLCDMTKYTIMTTSVKQRHREEDFKYHHNQKMHITWICSVNCKMNSYRTDWLQIWLFVKRCSVFPPWLCLEW